MLTAESDGERILKIGQHLPKLWAIKYRVVFFMKHPVHCSSCGRDELYASEIDFRAAFHYRKSIITLSFHFWL